MIRPAIYLVVSGWGGLTGSVSMNGYVAAGYYNKGLLVAANRERLIGSSVAVEFLSQIFICPIPLHIRCRFPKTVLPVNLSDRNHALCAFIERIYPEGFLVCFDCSLLVTKLRQGVCPCFPKIFAVGENLQKIVGE